MRELGKTDPDVAIVWRAFELRPDPCRPSIRMATICTESGVAPYTRSQNIRPGERRSSNRYGSYFWDEIDWLAPPSRRRGTELVASIKNEPQ